MWISGWGCRTATSLSLASSIRSSAMSWLFQNTSPSLLTAMTMFSGLVWVGWFLSLGSSTDTLWITTGIVMRKMISNTSITSTSGVVLMSATRSSSASGLATVMLMIRSPRACDRRGDEAERAVLVEPGDTLLHGVLVPEFLVGFLGILQHPSLLEHLDDADVPGADRHDHEYDQRAPRDEVPLPPKRFDAVGVLHDFGCRRCGGRRRFDLDGSGRSGLRFGSLRYRLARVDDCRTDRDQHDRQQALNTQRFAFHISRSRKQRFEIQTCREPAPRQYILNTYSMLARTPPGLPT